jgi:hypothetical protein
MASNSKTAELPEATVAGVPRVAQTVAAIPAKHRFRALEGPKQSYLQTVQDTGYAEPTPLKLYLSEDLLRHLGDEADKSGRSLNSEIVRRLLHSRVRDAQHGALRQIDSTAIAVDSAMDAVQQLLTLLKLPSPDD